MIQCELWKGNEFRQARQLFEIMNRMRGVWGRLRPVGMRPSELSTLVALARLEETGHGPVTIGTLAKEMGQSLPGVSQKVSELEKQGCLKRVTDERDRRVVTVGLTAPGRKVAGDALRSYLEKLSRRWPPCRRKS